MPTTTTTVSHSDWRSTHLGRLLGEAMRRFDARVLVLMTDDVLLPLALSNLAARQQVGAAHIHITRHLPLDGARLMDLAHAANMSKQAMGDLVDQCEAWNLVRRVPHPHDKRAKLIQFAPDGLAWLGAFERAVAQAQHEFQTDVGASVATVTTLGLEVYTAGTL
jgi:DNA-binding MarR family transcriptional regulator